MPIEIQETFQVAAPIDAVWRFVMNPENVAGCMPGAALEEVVDDRTFLGSIKIQLGAITTRYQGRVRLLDVNDETYAVRMEAEGREAGGGTARGIMSSRLSELPDGGTEIVAQASLDLTGRVVQVGRGMIQGVSRELFRQFVAQTRERLENPEGAAIGTGPGGTTPIRIVPLVLRTAWSAVVRFVQRLFGRPVE
jgi:carbon monoxide dehydrogenase subunit G